MKILVSACLMGENCKYNGKNNFSPKLAAYLNGHEAIPVCPEVLGGLPVPRKPAEIVGDRVINTDGISVDAAFRKGAEAALETAIESGAEIAVLQSRSPSCGAKQIYDGSFSGRLTEGEGIFAGLLRKNNIRVIDVEDL